MVLRLIRNAATTFGAFAFAAILMTVPAQAGQVGQPQTTGCRAVQTCASVPLYIPIGPGQFFEIDVQVCQTITVCPVQGGP